MDFVRIGILSNIIQMGRFKFIQIFQLYLIKITKVVIRNKIELILPKYNF